MIILAKVKKVEEKNWWGALVLGSFKHLLDDEMVRGDYRILLFLCQEVNVADNIAYLKQKQIVERLGMDKGNVSKSINKLCDKQFIARVENGFMINPHLFYIRKKLRKDREILREIFDETLRGNNLELRFRMYEDEYELEEWPDRPK